MTRNNNENFLENKHAHMMPRQYHRQPQYQHHHMGRNFPIANHRQPPYQQQSINQSPQVPQDHLIHMIRTIIREENNYQYHTQM